MAALEEEKAHAWPAERQALRAAREAVTAARQGMSERDALVSAREAECRQAQGELRRSQAKIAHESREVEYKWRALVQEQRQHQQLVAAQAQLVAESRPLAPWAPQPAGLPSLPQPVAADVTLPPHLQRLHSAPLRRKAPPRHPSAARSATPLAAAARGSRGSLWLHEVSRAATPAAARRHSLVPTEADSVRGRPALTMADVDTDLFLQDHRHGQWQVLSGSPSPAASHRPDPDPADAAGGRGAASAASSAQGSRRDASSAQGSGRDGTCPSCRAVRGEQQRLETTRDELNQQFLHLRTLEAKVLEQQAAVMSKSKHEYGVLQYLQDSLDSSHVEMEDRAMLYERQRQDVETLHWHVEAQKKAVWRQRLQVEASQTDLDRSWSQLQTERRALDTESEALRREWGHLERYASTAEGLAVTRRPSSAFRMDAAPHKLPGTPAALPQLPALRRSLPPLRSPVSKSNTRAFQLVLLSLDVLIDIKLAFQQADTAQASTLGAAELMAWTATLGVPRSEQEVRDMIDQADMSGSGTISFWEFLGIEVYTILGLQFPLHGWMQFVTSTNTDPSMPAPESRGPNASLATEGGPVELSLSGISALTDDQWL